MSDDKPVNNFVYLFGAFFLKKRIEKIKIIIPNGVKSSNDSKQK